MTLFDLLNMKKENEDENTFFNLNGTFINLNADFFNLNADFLKFI